jgi:putative hemolysin
VTQWLAMLPAWLPWAIVAVVAMALSACYSAAETGTYVLNKMRLELRAEGGSSAARSLRRMLRKSDALLSGLLIGANVAEYLATFGISAVFLQFFSPERAEWYTLAVATPLLFVVGESVPKNLAQRSPEKLVYRLVWFLRGSQWVLTACGVLPLVRAVGSLVARRKRGASPIAHEGLAAILAEGQASGVLTHAQSIMADRVMNLTDVLVADVMRPMRNVTSAPVDVSRDGLLERVRQTDFSRLPLLGPDGRVAGILDVYDVLLADAAVRPAEAMTPPLLVPGRWTVTDALYHMQKAHSLMAVVTDKQDRQAGIVTIKDLVEQIVGELGT